MINTGGEGQIHLVRISDAYWRVTFDMPPLNIFGPANIPQLEKIVSLLESDERVKVVVFDSAVEGFFLYHYDFVTEPEETAKFPLGRTGLHALPDMLARLSRAPVVSIASIRARDRRRQRARSRQRHAVCQPRKGCPLPMGGGGSFSTRWRSHGSASETNRSGESSRSAAGGGWHKRRPCPTLWLRQSLAEGQ